MDRNINRMYMDHHINDMKRSAGSYEYITTSDQLVEAYKQSHRELNQIIRYQRARDRFILNAAALEREIREDTIRAMQQGAYDVAGQAAAYLADQLMSLTGAGGGSRKPGKKSVDLGAAMGKAAGQAIVDLFDQTWEEMNR